MKYRLHRFLLFVVAFVVAVGCATMDIGESDLITASRAGHTERVKALLASGADVNAKDKDGVPAFMVAAMNGHTETVKALMAAGADVNAKDNNGDTALMVAEKKGHSYIVQLLKRAGAKK